MLKDIQTLLAELVTWNHDPELVDSLREYADQGNMDAQYALGLVYAEGRGVEQDEVLSYRWLSLAAAQGDQDALTLRHVVSESMTAEQIARAEQQVAVVEMKRSNARQH